MIGVSVSFSEIKKPVFMDWSIHSESVERFIEITVDTDTWSWYYKYISVNFVA